MRPPPYRVSQARPDSTLSDGTSMAILWIGSPSHLYLTEPRNYQCPTPPSYCSRVMRPSPSVRTGMSGEASCQTYCWRGLISSPVAAALLAVLQFAAQIPCADAVNLIACGARVQEQQNATQNTCTTEPPLALCISYEQCLVACGPGMGSVNWQNFSQNFGAWLLPWITLMFQIPFGAERKSRVSVLYRI